MVYSFTCIHFFIERLVINMVKRIIQKRLQHHAVTFKQSVRESNPCFRRERAAS